ncbi:ABC transporter permease [Butyrivibrio sp. AE2005]|uniref:ABC transporter permease n=1 Tax=Butyrivibrio sp. AE2005 TaxID=1496722 RepID=UPI00047BA17A|nr:FtsX-like permease family protein [Butyrivibrio sp. AE2005]
MAKEKRINGPMVNNKKVIRSIAAKTVMANPGKSLVVVLSIALCTFMFSALFTISGSLIAKFQDDTNRQIGTSCNAGVKYLNEEEYNRIASDKNLKSVTKSIFVATAVNDELSKIFAQVDYHDEASAKKDFCYPEVGRLPEKETEISVSSLILQAFGMKADSKEDYESLLGKNLSLKLSGKDKEQTIDFVIVGIHTGDQVAMAQIIVVSKEFQEKFSPTPTSSYYDNAASMSFNDCFGRIDAEVDFFFPLFFKYQIEKAIKRNGLPEDTQYGINWGSVGSSADFGAIAFVVLMLFTIFLSGYLIINNIYRINVYTDIRSYGLLKTVGTSSKQLKKIVNRQALYHSVPGIIIGITGGIVAGSLLLPMLMDGMAISESIDSKAVINIWILLFSALFSYVTVRISVRKATKLASGVSPIEALHYTENNSFRGRHRNHSATFTATRFAFRNVFKEKKKCFFVVLSLALSMTVLSTVFTLLIGFDENKYISNFLMTDFSVADATTDNLAVSNNVYDGITQSFLDEVKKLAGISKLGNVYAEPSIQDLNDRDYARFKERLLDNEKAYENSARHLSAIYYDESGEQTNDDTYTIANIYGMDDYALSTLKILHGNFDAEKFKTGKYILVNEYDYDGNESNFVSYFLPGETIAVNNANGDIREYEVMATIDIPFAVRIQAYTDMDVNYVLPTDEFHDFFGERAPMRTLIDATDDAEPAIENWLADYTKNVEPSLTYTSKSVFRKEFSSMTEMFKMVGGLLTTILALIGILNFINTIVTSVISRRLELAMLEAVGMTKSIQKKSLCIEGVIYGTLSLLFGAILSSIISILMIKPLESGLFFFSYMFTLLPIVVVLPFLILVMILIPYIVYKRAMKETIIERLRLADA